MFLQEHKIILSGHGGKVLDSARGLYKYTSISSDSRTFEVEVAPRPSQHNCTTVCGTYNHTYSPIPLRHSIVMCMVLGNLGKLWLHLSENSPVVIKVPYYRMTSCCKQKPAFRLVNQRENHLICCYAFPYKFVII